MVTDADDVRYDELLKERESLLTELANLRAEFMAMAAELERIESRDNETNKRNLKLAEKLAYLAKLRK